MSKIFEIRTSRLLIRRLTLEDAGFILELLNTPGWLEHIGDKGVHNIEEAINYIASGPLNHYSNGKGLGLHAIEYIESIEDQCTVGLCGLLQRTYLDCPDIGYAILPNFEGNGIIKEACLLTLKYASEVLELRKIAAITSPENKRSIGLLGKLGFQLIKVLQSEEEEINHYQIDLALGLL